MWVMRVLDRFSVRVVDVHMICPAFWPMRLSLALLPFIGCQAGASSGMEVGVCVSKRRYIA